MRLLKKIAPLVASVSLIFAGSALAQENVEKEIKKTPILIGSAYGEFSYFTAGYNPFYNENPASLNFLSGYNILHKKNIKNGALLFPNLRIRLKGDKIENLWNNYAEIGIGTEYLNDSFAVGIDAGYLKGLYGLDKEGFFGRIWSYYWNRWSLKNLLESKIFPMRPQFIASGDLEATTLTGGLDVNERLEGGMVIFEKDNLNVLPFVALSANANTHWDYIWNNYLRSGGGLRAQKGPFFLFVEGGYQNSLNGGNSGLYLYGGASVYLPIGK